MNHQTSVKLIAGKSNNILASQIAKLLGVDLLLTETEHFSNDNYLIRFHESVRGKQVYILQSLNQPVHDYLIQTLMMGRIARDDCAKEVVAIIPYFSYSRSDKQDQPLSSLSAKLMADLIEASGFDRAIFVDLHAPQIQGFFNIPIDHLQTEILISEIIREWINPDTILVAPDLRATPQVKRIAEKYSVPFIVAHKRRLGDTQVEIELIYNRLNKMPSQGIIIDDSLITGGTVETLCKKLREQGVQQIDIAVTHAVIVDKCLERLRRIAPYRVLISDTIQHPPQIFDGLNIQTFSVASLICNVITRSSS